MTIHFSDEQDDPLEPEALIALARRVLASEGFGSTAEISMALVSTDRMTELNETYMGRSGPTDVLAFPLESLQPGEVVSREPGGPPVMLGDVFIAPAVVQRHATEFESTFEDEMSLMVTHGILHLLGYDHVDDDDARVMEGREKTLLAAVGRVRR
jgi:probable rRNA maturation factor